MYKWLEQGRVQPTIMPLLKQCSKVLAIYYTHEPTLFVSLILYYSMKSLVAT